MTKTVKFDVTAGAYRVWQDCLDNIYVERGDGSYVVTDEEDVIRALAAKIEDLTDEVVATEDELEEVRRT